MSSEDIFAYVAGLEEEVERLRAVQPVLPDVGPVTRDPRGWLVVDGIPFVTQSGRDVIEASLRPLMRQVARREAMLAFLDAEAADTSSDDERDEIVAKVLEDNGVLEAGDSFFVVRDIVRALDEHRAARTSEKSGPLSD